MKKYDIYIKEKILYQSVNEQEFDVTWNTLHHMINLLDTNYTIEDLRYEEISH
jgi:hypothetical protein